jgi:hypothetical protein
MTIHSSSLVHVLHEQALELNGFYILLLHDFISGFYILFLHDFISGFYILLLHDFMSGFYILLLHDFIVFIICGLSLLTNL